MKKLLVLTALPHEHKLVKKQLLEKTLLSKDHGTVSGLLGQIPVEAAFTELGLDATRKNLGEILDSTRHGGVLFVGYCGGLSLPLKVGDVVVASKVLNPKPSEFNFEMDLLLAEKLGKVIVEKGRKYRVVPLATVEKAVETPALKAELMKTSKAEACDMEASEVVSACRERNIPVIVVKVVADDCDQTLPEFQSSSLTHPVLALEMSRNIKKAASVLSEVLEPLVLEASRFWKLIP